jgi:hypothetical protein
VKAFLVAAGCIVAGLAAGGIWTLAQPDRYRADARVLIRPGTSRIVPAVEALAESSLVESNVAQTLHLSSPPHVSASSGKGGVLTVSVTAGSRERARQIDAEAVTILTQKVAQRFGATPGVSATVLDPAHAAEQTSPTPARNLLITGLIGLLAGVAAAMALTPKRRPAVATRSTDPRLEQRLQARVDQVTKRERALAKRAGELAAREKQAKALEEALAAASSRSGPREEAVARREQELAAREAGLEERAAELLAAQSVEPQPEPEPEPRPVAALSAPILGRWTIDELEHAVAERRADQPARVEEWNTYLYFLREHAGADGTLPRSFDSLVSDIFGDILGV